MSTKKYLSLIMIIVILICSLNFSFAQIDYNIINSCSMIGTNNPEWNFPVKPPITGEHYIRILIVYVMFDNETFDEYNQVWLSNTSNGPTYKGTLLAQNKNAISECSEP